MDFIEYQVLLPNKFLYLIQNKEELKQMIKQYFRVSYLHYKIQRVIKSGQAHVVVCMRR